MIWIHIIIFIGSLIVFWESFRNYTDKLKLSELLLSIGITLLSGCIMYLSGEGILNWLLD